MKPEAKMPNKALHRTAIPLRSIAAGELGRYPASAVGSVVAEDGSLIDSMCRLWIAIASSSSAVQLSSPSVHTL